MYHQVAVHFADLHDTPERMLEKNCIQEIVPWKTARRQLYWRLRRRLLEENMRSQILSTQSVAGVRQVDAMLRRWFVEDKGATSSYLWDQDEAAVSWLESQLQNENSVVSRNMTCVRRDAVITQVKNALDSCPDVRMGAILEMANSLQPNERQELLRTLSQLENPNPERREDSNSSP